MIHYIQTQQEMYMRKIVNQLLSRKAMTSLLLLSTPLLSVAGTTDTTVANINFQNIFVYVVLGFVLLVLGYIMYALRVFKEYIHPSEKKQLVWSNIIKNLTDAVPIEKE